MSVQLKILLAVALTCGSVIAVAAPPAGQVQQSMQVQFQDLNLNRPEDVVILYRRLRLAAEQACGPRALTGSFYKAQGYEQCVTDAVSRAVRSIDRPSLSVFARHRGWIRDVSADRAVIAAG